MLTPPNPTHIDREAGMAQPPRYAITFPPYARNTVGEGDWQFQINENGEQISIRSHDYGEIFDRPGLYEQLFHERLHCRSPEKALEAVQSVMRDNNEDPRRLRLLDLGAGNGMVGELLHSARAVGLDISPEARDACERDRPQVYDAYHVADMTAPGEELMEELRRWDFDMLACLSALGYGDIPTAAFINAYNLIADNGWIVFNIRENFLRSADQSGFSALVWQIMRPGGALEVHRMERYQHRYSIDGEPIFYYMFVGRKRRDIAGDMLETSR